MNLNSEAALSRRTLLQVGAASLVPLVMPGIGRADDKKTGAIDAHVHVWSGDTKKYPIAAGQNKDQYEPAQFTPEDLLKECRPQGVNRIVLIQMSFYEYDNTYMLEAIRNAPGTFRGVAIIDEKLSTAPKTMRELLKEGVTGFRLYANRENVVAWQNSPEMHKMWRTAAETGQAICLLANPDALPPIRKLLEKFPKTPVVIDHFARIGISGTVDESPLNELCKLSEFKQLTVKTSAFYALGKKTPPYTDLAPMIRRLRDAYGEQRLMWASDCPFQVLDGHSYAASISLIRDRLDFLSEEEKKWILSGTAERVYWFA